MFLNGSFAFALNVSTFSVFFKILQYEQQQKRNIQVLSILWSGTAFVKSNNIQFV